MERKGVIKDVNEIGEETVLTMTEKVELQMVEVAPHADGYPWQSYCPQSDKEQYKYFKLPRQERHIGGAEQHDKAQQREEFGTEDARKSTG